MALENKLPEIVQAWLDKHPDISITKLAQMADVNPSTISVMLRNKPRRVDIDTATALKKVIGFNAADIIVEVED
jgi:plasmid maintenance system antidote protein VapI